MAARLLWTRNDVHRLTNYSIGHCRRIIRKIKSEKKLKHQKGLEEVSEYLGLSPELIRILSLLTNLYSDF